MKYFSVAASTFSNPYVLVLSPVLDSIEDIYPIIETLFQHSFRYLEVHWKLCPERTIFSSLLGVWECDETQSLAFEIILAKSVQAIVWMRVQLRIYTTCYTWKFSQNCTAVSKNFEISRVGQLQNWSSFRTSFISAVTDTITNAHALIFTAVQIGLS